MPVPLSAFEEIYRRHGHRCPMSTLGGRLGYAASRHVADCPRALQAVYHARTCAVDGIEHTTGCTLAGGDLVVKDEGRHVLTLVCGECGEGVEVALRESTLDLAADYRRVGAELERLRPLMGAAEIEFRERQREAALDVLLHRLRTLPEEVLLTVRPLTAEVREG